MGRLTYKNPDGTWGINGIHWEEINHKLYGALCKLKDYEETGLSPEEIEQLRYEDVLFPKENKETKQLILSTGFNMKEEIRVQQLKNAMDKYGIPIEVTLAKPSASS